MATADLFPVERIEKAILAALWPVSDRATLPTEGPQYRGRPSVGGFGGVGDPRRAGVVSCQLLASWQRMGYYGGVDYTLMVVSAFEITVCDLKRDVVGGGQIGGHKL